jgi:hypothetical protein
MKKETIGHLARVSMLVIAALATCAFAATASAQSSFTGKFTLTYEVHPRTVVIPAGDYAPAGSDSIFPCENNRLLVCSRMHGEASSTPR